MPKDPRFIDRRGIRRGRLVITEYAGKGKFGHLWICTCDCGNKVTLEAANILKKEGGTQSCGCQKREWARTMGKSCYKSIVGQKAWNLTCVRPLSGSFCEFLCDCGNLHRMNKKHFGTIKSCGCHRKKHGMSQTGMYMAWNAMIERCCNPNCEAFKHYGGRGISVCERWRDFRNFLADMGERPAGMTIERENNDGNYEPGNCRWATMKEQGRNKRTTRILTHNGRTMPLMDWAEELGVSCATIHNRIQRWGLEAALSTPPVRSIPRSEKGSFLAVVASVARG